MENQIAGFTQVPLFGCNPVTAMCVVTHHSTPAFLFENCACAGNDHFGLTRKFKFTSTKSGEILGCRRRRPTHRFPMQPKPG